MTNEQVIKDTWAKVSQANFSNLLMRTGLLKQIPPRDDDGEDMFLFPNLEGPSQDEAVDIVIFELAGKEVFGTYKGTRVFVYRTGG